MEAEIDFERFKSVVLENRKLLLRLLIVSVILGIVIYFTTPKEWKSEAVVFVEQESLGLGNLSGSLGSLASIAGVNIGGALGGENLNPLSYEDIVKDKGFLMGFLDSTYYFSERDEYYQLEDFFLNHKGYSIMGRVFKAKDDLIDWIKPEDELQLEDSSIVFYTDDELEIISELQKRIVFSFDIEKQLANITVKMQDPVASAQLTEDLYKKLDSYIQDYLIQDEKRNFDFMSSQAMKRKQELDSIKNVYARFVDSNQNINSELVRIQTEHLRAEYDLAFNIYSTLEQQIEETRIRLDKEIISLKKVGPVAIPDEKSSPNIIISLFIPLFLSMFGFLVYVFKLKPLRAK